MVAKLERMIINVIVITISIYLYDYGINHNWIHHFPIIWPYFAGVFMGIREFKND